MFDGPFLLTSRRSMVPESCASDVTLTWCGWRGLCRARADSVSSGVTITERSRDTWGRQCVFSSVYPPTLSKSLCGRLISLAQNIQNYSENSRDLACSRDGWYSPITTRRAWESIWQCLRIIEPPAPCHPTHGPRKTHVTRHHTLVRLVTQFHVLSPGLLMS